MKATEFAYWLQGYFEIKGESSLTKDQADLILKKIETVQPEQTPVESKAFAFASYAQGLLTAALDGNNLATCSPGLQTRLNDLFIHAIDPTLPGDQEQLRRTHRPSDGGPRAMC